METTSKKAITVEVTVNAPKEKVWEIFTKPEYIMKWNHASDDWHTTASTNDVRTGGKFSSRMEAKDGSMGFDFNGIYKEVKTGENISYDMEDGRQVFIKFKSEGSHTKVTETFDPESQNSIEMQRGGWQAILDNFKKYAES